MSHLKACQCKSQNLSLMVRETVLWARELLQGRSPDPGGEQSKWSPQSSKAEPPVANAKGDEHGVEQHQSRAWLSQQWSGACRSYTFRVVHSTLPGLLISVLASLMARGEFPQKPICGWSHSADLAILIICAILGVSPCQMGLA